jgi:hypothetical protein
MRFHVRRDPTLSIITVLQTFAGLKLLLNEGKLSKANGNFIIGTRLIPTSKPLALGHHFFHWDDEFDITGNATGQSSRNGTVNTLDQEYHLLLFIKKQTAGGSIKARLHFQSMAMKVPWILELEIATIRRRLNYNGGSIPFTLTLRTSKNIYKVLQLRRTL